MTSALVALALSLVGPGLLAPTDAGAAPSAAPAGRPRDVVAWSVSQGRAADDLFDVDALARRSLGQHWKTLLPDEREQFVRLFRDVLTRSFVTLVARRAGERPVPLDEAVAGHFAQVRPRLSPLNGSDSTIEYRLTRTGSQWTVYDIVFDGRSLVSSYRAQFHAILGTSSTAELLERMRTEPSLPSLPSRTDPSARSRLVAGLVVGVMSQGRWSR